MTAATKPPKDGASVGELCKALGVSKQTVCDWRAKGWLVKSPSGAYYDIEATRQRVATLRGPTGGKTGGALATVYPPGPAPDSAPARAPAPDGAPLSREEAETRAATDPELRGLTPEEIVRRTKIADMLQAEHNAGLAGVKLRERKGELHDTAECGAKRFVWARTIRDAVLGVRYRCSAEIVAAVLDFASDPAAARAAVEALLDREHRAALRDLRPAIEAGIATTMDHATEPAA